MEEKNNIIDETIYQYDYKNRAWVETAKRYDAFPAKDVPVILFGEFDLGEWDYQCFHAHRRQRMMWCAEHKRFEKIHHIERIDSIRSVEGCRERGMAAHFSFCVPPIERKLTVPYRWKITLYENGEVEVKADALRFRLVYTGENVDAKAARPASASTLGHHCPSEYNDTMAEKYIARPRRITLSEVFDIENGESVFCNSRRDWQDFGLDLPPAVTAKAFEYLQENSKADRNLLQESITDGAKKLRAFVKRPADFHIEYWRDFFSYAEFERLFPPKQKDNFSALCRALKLTPTEHLRAAYYKNPYAPLWEKLLRFWGFKDEKAISYFYELKDFAGMRLPHFSFDRDKDEIILNGLKGWSKDDTQGFEFLEDTETVTAYEAHNRFAALRFYVAWALSQNKERAFAKRGLYALAAKPWSNDLHEELELFYWRFRSYCHYACKGEGDNPWAEIAADTERLSVMTRHHLLGFNTEWFGWHWQIEHNRLMEEFHALGSPKESVLERKQKKKLTRLERILKIYDAILTNSSPLIPIKKSEYPPSMFKRDMKVIEAFDPSIARDKNGQIRRKTRYRLGGEFPALPDDSRCARLLAYRLFLADCGHINMELAEKIAGKKISRRTFVRDLEILRETCACGILTYRAAEKIYVWESFGDD